jgi:hypothetical protein
MAISVPAAHAANISVLDKRATENSADAADTAGRLTEAMRGVPFVKTPEIPLRPVVLEAARYTHYWRVIERFTRILERTCWGISETPSHLYELLGPKSAESSLLTDSLDEKRWSACMSRSDAILSNGELKVLECNMGGGIGGVVSTQILAESYTNIFGSGRNGISALKPFSARRNLFLQAVRDRQSAMSVAILGTMRDPGIGDRRYFDLEVDYLRRSGLHADFVEPEDLLDRVGNGTNPQLGAVLRHFVPSDWRAAGIDLTPVRVASDHGVLMLSPEASSLLANKAVLAWMSAGVPWMSHDDRAFCRRHLPWTRMVDDSRVTWQGREWNLPTLLYARREKFVLKPAKGYGGQGVVVGTAVDEASWRHAVGEAVEEGDFIVQEYVQPDPVPMSFYHTDNDQAFTTHVSPVYGFLRFGGIAAGCLVRHTSTESLYVLNATQGAVINIAVTPGV